MDEVVSRFVPDTDQEAPYLQRIEREVYLVAKDGLQEDLVEMKVDDSRVVESSTDEHAQALENRSHVPVR
jgi:hypothetical protein